MQPSSDQAVRLRRGQRFAGMVLWWPISRLSWRRTIDRVTGCEGFPISRGVVTSKLGLELHSYAFWKADQVSAQCGVTTPLSGGVAHPNMQVDIGNALATEASPGLQEDALERLDQRVEHAHERITRGMNTGEFGYTSLDLPERTDAAAIESAVEPVAGADAVLTVGIGGSALGAATISTALGADTHYVLDNVDPEYVLDTLDTLSLETTVINVVSRSGTTPETLANFLVVREAYEQAGVDWTDRTLVTTGTSGPLRELAERNDLPTLPTAEGVPGRFGALSTVGLTPIAILGYDVEAVLAGGRAGCEALAPSLFDCPAYAYGAIAHALEVRGATVNVMMPYAERLEPFAEWFAQLWAESLGKEGLGQTPVRALGVTDQHSQLQLFRAGRRDKLVSFVRLQDGVDRSIPTTAGSNVGYLGDSTLRDLLEAEFRATEASLAAAGRPNVRIEVERMDARSIGRLLYGMEAACVLAGELADVATFTQPAVEWGKRATRGLLGEGEFDEAATVGEKTTHVVK